MKAEHLECRSLGHQWSNIINQLGPNFHVSSTCLRCGWSKEATYNRHGWRMTRRGGKYPDGYLFPKGKAKDKATVRTALFNGKELK